MSKFLDELRLEPERCIGLAVALFNADSETLERWQEALLSDDDAALSDIGNFLLAPAVTAAYNPDQPRCPVGTGSTAGEFSNKDFTNCNPMTVQLKDRALMDRIEMIGYRLDGYLKPDTRAVLENEVELAKAEVKRRRAGGTPQGTIDPEGVDDEIKIRLSEDTIDSAARLIILLGDPANPDDFIAKNFEKYSEFEIAAIKDQLEVVRKLKGFSHDQLMEEMRRGNYVAASAELSDRAQVAYDKHGVRIADDGWNSHAGAAVTIDQGPFVVDRVAGGFEDAGASIGTFTDEQVEVVKKIYDRITAHPDIAELTEKWGHPHIFPMQDTPATGVVIATPYRFPEEVKTLRGTMIMALNTKMFDEVEGLDLESDIASGIPVADRFTADYTVEGVIRHELMHWFEAQKSAQRLMPRFSDTEQFKGPLGGKAALLREQLSKYSTVNFQETFAELGATYYGPTFQREDWDPSLVASMVDMHRWLNEDPNDSNDPTEQED